MSPRSWQERIQDILDAIAEIEAFAAGMSRDQFLADPKTLKAVAADLTIIGEAARHVPQAVFQAHPEIPWPLITGMRKSYRSRLLSGRSGDRLGHVPERPTALRPTAEEPPGAESLTREPEETVYGDGYLYPFTDK